MKILIIEQNKATVSPLKTEMIRKWGYEAERASTGLEALAMLSWDLYDMVILDIDLPDGKGHGLISHIKKLHPDIYIATMTGNNSRDLEREIRTQGIIYYMMKPLDMNEIKDILAHNNTKKHKEVR
ncbi:MAG: response regulator [Deltaproteobacteria bacterium]|nr:response regulator [Deltaproteobacteria bacterium]MBN2845451.1 response regulator [Deltaproteobacteria bacterium]